MTLKGSLLPHHPNSRSPMPTRPAPEVLAYPLFVAFTPVMLGAEEVYDGLGRNLTLGGTLGAHCTEGISTRPPVPEADVVDGLGTVGFM